MNSTENLKQLISAEIEKIPNTKPVALLLSGGIDSSLVLSLLRETQPFLSILTFTIARDKNYPDILFARKIAQIFNTQHYEIIPSPEEIDKFTSEFKKISRGEEKHKGNLNLYILCKLVRRCTNILVTGDGGDECFGGYWLHEYPLGHRETGQITCFENIHPDTKKHLEEMVRLGFRDFLYKAKSEREDYEAVWEYFVEVMLPRHLEPLSYTSKILDIDVYTPLFSKALLNFMRTLPYIERLGFNVFAQTNRRKREYRF